MSHERRMQLLMQKRPFSPEFEDDEPERSNSPLVTKRDEILKVIEQQKNHFSNLVQLRKLKKFVTVPYNRETSTIESTKNPHSRHECRQRSRALAPSTQLFLKDRISKQKQRPNTRQIPENAFLSLNDIKQ